MRLALTTLLAVSLFACGSKSDSGGGGGSAKGSDTKGSDMKGSDMKGSDMKGSDMKGSDMKGSDAKGSDAKGSDAAGSGSAGSGSAVAAGSGSGSAAAPPDDGFHFDVTTTLKDKTFEQLAHEDQIKFMKENVVGQMKKEFQAFDGKKYANFGCPTCHGKDFKAKNYKMPNPDLPKLDFAKLEKGEQKPKMAKFMGLHTKPDMAKILNLTPYDEQHKDGFGCLHCHEAKK